MSLSVISTLKKINFCFATTLGIILAIAGGMAIFYGESYSFPDSQEYFLQAENQAKYEHSLSGKNKDFVFTSSSFRQAEEGLHYRAGLETFQRAVLMRAVNGNRWDVSVQVKWLAGDTMGAGVYFCYENMASFYYIGLNGSEIYLIRNGDKIYTIRYQAQKNQWIDLRIRRQDDRFQLWLNDEMRLDYQEKRPLRDIDDNDRNPLPFGGYALGSDGDVSPNSEVLFRDLKISGNPGQYPLKHAYQTQIMLENGKKNVILWLEHPDDRAIKRVRVLAQSIKIMEHISGLVYPPELSAEALSIRFDAEYPFHKLGQAFYPDINILLSEEKTQEFLNSFAQLWDYFQELWLASGFPLFLSGAATQELSGKPFIFKNVKAFKKALDKMNSPVFKDFALDGVYIGPDDVLHQILKRKGSFFAEKGSLFLYMVYRDLGAKVFAAVCRRAVKNLDFKRFQRNNRIGSEDFLEALTDVAQTHYKAFFNGWIFPGKYSQWSPQFFIDEDQDGLLLMEEKIIGTSDKKPDTDGDGYSDVWEYLNGFDPLDAQAPSVARVAVDGYVIEWSSFDDVAEVPDPLNDITSSFNPFDVRKVMMRADDVYLYIGVQYHNDIRLNRFIAHRFKFRFNGQRFNVGVIDLEEEDFMAQQLQGRDLWYDYAALDKGFTVEFGVDMEVKVPIDYFDGATRIELQYSGPAEMKGNKVDLNADPVEALEIFAVESNGKRQFVSLPAYQTELWGFYVETVMTSAHQQGYEGYRTIDLRPESYWAGKKEGDWLQFKLNREAMAKNLLLLLDKNSRNKIKVEVSRNGDDWQTIIEDKQLNQAVDERVIPIKNSMGTVMLFQYIRIRILEASNKDGIAIYEVGFER